jgi:beta-glucosidase
MNTKKIKHIAIAVILTSQFSNGQQNANIYKKGWIDFNKNGVMDVYENPKVPIEKRVQDLISQMNLDEKTCQMATLYGLSLIHI